MNTFIENDHVTEVPDGDLLDYAPQHLGNDDEIWTESQPDPETDATDTAHSYQTVLISKEASPHFQERRVKVINRDEDIGLIEQTNHYLPDGDGDGKRPIVYVQRGELAKTLSAIDNALKSSGHFFQRSGKVVVVVNDGQGKAIKDANISDLMLALSTTTKWMRLQNRTSAWDAVDPDERTCRHYLNLAPSSSLPHIVGIAHQPFLRMDGSMCQQSGFDTASGLYCIFDDSTVQAAAAPTRENAARALEQISGLLDEFAFASTKDRSAALCAILTAAVRPSLPLAPMFHISAHQPGSGKSYLCRLIAAFATSNHTGAVNFPRSQDDCDKLMLAQLIRSPALIEFDNLTTDLKAYDKLCSALTSEYIEGRVLGTSGTTAVSTKVLMLSSGNNVRPVADMLRRTVVINLDPGVESPAARAFSRPQLVEEVLADRSKYVSAALTVVRAWLMAAENDVDCTPLSSYTVWSDWCRKSLIWLGHEDPAHSIFKGLEDDPEKRLLGRVLHCWYERHGSSQMMVRSLVADASCRLSDDGLLEALIEASGGLESINTRKLGRWISQNQGRVVGGLRIARAPKSRNAENWQVESVTSV